MRHNFSRKVRNEAKARANGRCEAEGTVYGLPVGQRCNAPLAGKRLEIDHYPIPATDEGSDVLSNAVTCCKQCHDRKTASYDIPMQAKGKRLADRDAGFRKASSFQSASFAPAIPQHSATRELTKRVGYFPEETP